MSNFNKIILLIVLIVHFRLYAQDENKISKSHDLFSVSYFKALNIGDNFLNKAHEFKHGIAVEINFKTYKNFYLGAGYNHSKYEVTNRELVGEYPRGNHVVIYLNALMIYDIAKKLSISPQYNLGISYFNAKKQGADIKNQIGFEMKLGAKLSYELSNEFGIIYSIHYVRNQFVMNANPEIRKFYNHSQSINFGLGIILF